MKKTTRSGSGSSATKLSEKDLKEYDFLSWLTPCIRLRQTQSKVTCTEESKDPDDEDDDENIPDVLKEETDNDSYACNNLSV